MGDDLNPQQPLPHLNRALLERLDERTASILEDLAEIKKELANKYVSKDTFETIKDTVQNMPEVYVTKDEFAPVRKIVYGLVGLVLTGVVAAILALVIVAV